MNTMIARSAQLLSTNAASRLATDSMCASLVSFGTRKMISTVLTRKMSTMK